MIYDSIGTLLTNIGLFGGGMAFGILGLIFGIARGMTKNHDMWALIFSAFAWTMALIAPNTLFAGTIFVAGAIGITLAYTPLIKQATESNIFLVAIIAALINVSMLIGVGAFGESLNWGTNIDEVQTDIITILGQETTAISQETPAHGLCTPSQERAGTCTPSAIGGTFNPLIFDVFASILTIGDYIGKAIKFAGMAVFAPFIISGLLAGMVTNGFIGYMIGLYATFWNLVVLYNIIKFILNKRGMA